MPEKKAKSKAALFFGRLGIFLLTTFLMVITALLSIIYTVARGPSESAQRLFVMSVKETSAIGFLADWFFSEEEINEIIGSGRNSETAEKTDSTLIKVVSASSDSSQDIPKKDTAAEEKELELVDVMGSTYKGKLLIVKDPSRVIVGVSGSFGDGCEGRTVQQIAADYGAVAGTNAGGFSDPGGVSKGGKPLGAVFSQGEFKYGNLGETYELIGFDSDNILHVGRVTGQQAVDEGIRDGVCFGPILIVNGKAQNEEKNLGGGLNPRTAIGQRADGAVLILVIDGRQASSLGATYDDLIEVMLRYGAVNAANLDGGSSSHMIYNDELITECSSIYGPRKMPTAILVV